MSKFDPFCVWISWEMLIRNRNTASSMNVPLFKLISEQPRMIRYVTMLCRSTVLLWRYRGHWVFVQNLSIVLAYWAASAQASFWDISTLKEEVKAFKVDCRQRSDVQINRLKSQLQPESGGRS